MKIIFDFIRKYKVVIIGLLLVMVIAGGIEIWSGRSLLGADGLFGLWDGNILGSENSQRVADAYSFSHIIHGMIFYWFLWLVARKVPVKYRFIMALGLEAGWELLGNSPIIIDRYPAATIAQGYVG